MSILSPDFPTQFQASAVRGISQPNFKHPRLEGSVIAFNEKLSLLKWEKIAPDVVLLFEVKGGLNEAGNEELIRNNNPDRIYVDYLLFSGKIDQYSIKMGGTKKKNTWRGITYLKVKWKP